MRRRAAAPMLRAARSSREKTHRDEACRAEAIERVRVAIQGLQALKRLLAEETSALYPRIATAHQACGVVTQRSGVDLEPDLADLFRGLQQELMGLCADAEGGARETLVSLQEVEFE